MQSSLTDTTMLAFYENNANESFAKAVRFENVLQSLADTPLANDSIAIYAILDSANQINNSIESAAMPQYVDDYKKTNHLFLKYFAYGASALDSNDVEQITKLAFSCPYEDGEGVYTARYLYHQLSDTIYHFDDLIFCTVEEYGKRDESEDVENRNIDTKLEEKELKVIPNPTRGEVQIIFSLGKDETATLNFFDLTGKQITDNITLREKGIVTLNLNTLANGIYTYIAIGNKDSFYSGKLVIAK